MTGVLIENDGVTSASGNRPRTNLPLPVGQIEIRAQAEGILRTGWGDTERDWTEMQIWCCHETTDYDGGSSEVVT